MPHNIILTEHVLNYRNFVMISWPNFAKYLVGLIKSNLYIA